MASAWRQSDDGIPQVPASAGIDSGARASSRSKPPGSPSYVQPGWSATSN